VRRLLILLSAVVAVDTMFYTALAPLLPHFTERYDLSKTGAGVLFAVYGAGVLAAGIPGGIAASRFGPKRAVLFGVAVTAVATLVFALAGSAWMLSVARLVQGFGSAFSWAGALAWLVGAGPPGRRGTLIGTAMGAAVFGALLGPALGALATVVGVRPTFIAISTVGLVICAWVAGTPGVAAQPQSLAAFRRADRRLLFALWLIVLPSLLFGVLDVLAPLTLHAAGWGGVAIGALFFVTAAAETVLNPFLGRFTDRRGRLLPVRLALLGSIVVSFALAWSETAAVVAFLVFASAMAYGAFYTPGMALFSESAERIGIAQGLAFGAMNGAWAAGALVAPAAGGALAQAGGDTLPYLLLAAICLATLVVVRPSYAQSSSRPSSA
jgi:MFS family permease